MRAIGYIRASTDKQLHTLEAQHTAIEQWCDRAGAELVEVVTDADVSGTVPFGERPGGAMVLARAGETPVDVIVTTMIDRLFRNALDGLTCLHVTFPRLGLAAVAVYEAIDTGTPEGKFQTTLKLALAELERDKTAERTLRTSRRLQETGRVYGATPFGCQAVDGRLYRDPLVWAVRQHIVDQLAERSFRDVQLHLRGERICAPNGSRQWSTSTLKHLRDTHDRLSQLPRLQDARDAAQRHEARVSPIHPPIHRSAAQ